MEKELVLFSGGKDSFLTALKGIKEGNHVVLATYTNGCIQGVENATKTAEIILNKYGHEYVTILELKSCIKEFQLLRDLYIIEPISKLSKDYPNLLINQLNCIACRSAMYINAIKYCIDNDISIMSEGARRSQPYLVQKGKILNGFKDVCDRFSITLKTPLYDFDNDYWIKLDITKFDITYAKTYEMQCWMGVPEGLPPTNEQIDSIEEFFLRVIKPRMNRLLELEED